MAKDQSYEQGSLSLWGTIAMGTGVMIGAGIFALTGQVAGRIREVKPIAQIFEETIEEYHRVVSRLPR